MVFSAIAVTKLDVLDSFETIKLCTSYRLGDQVITDMPEYCYPKAK